MNKRLVSVGVVLLLSGAAVFGWGLVVQRNEKFLLQDIKSRLERLEKVGSDDVNIRLLADIFSGEDWQQRLDNYNTKRQTRELLVDTSAVFAITAMAIFAWWVLTGIFGLLRRLLRYLQGKGRTEAQPGVLYAEGVSGQQRRHKRARRDGKATEHSRLLASLGWLDFAKTGGGNAGELSVNSLGGQGNLNAMFCDERAGESKKSLKFQAEKDHTHEKAMRIHRAELERETDDAFKIEKALRAQKEALERQVAEFKEVAEVVKQVSQERPELDNDTIRELVQQVSAIRDYALNQQDRIKKLQDGYDWNIIKAFGLKVIRCLDNLDDRIERLSQAGADTTDEEEVRDELIFALESSGIEQYEPEVDSDYSGQERTAEAVKERVGCEGAQLKGKVAQVIRPGYRHCIDEHNFKIIRSARVKLFG